MAETIFIRRAATRAAALHVDTQAALTAAAVDVASRARAIAAEHVDSGDYLRSIKVARGKVDRHVYTDDPLAVSKEFGRTGARGRGRSNGVHALTRAAEGEG